jgi:hypothetical protein
LLYFQILLYCRIKKADRHFGILYYAVINNSAGESFAVSPAMSAERISHLLVWSAAEHQSGAESG